MAAATQSDEPTDTVPANLLRDKRRLLWSLFGLSITFMILSTIYFSLLLADDIHLPGIVPGAVCGVLATAIIGVLASYLTILVRIDNAGIAADLAVLTKSLAKRDGQLELTQELPRPRGIVAIVHQAEGTAAPSGAGPGTIVDTKARAEVIELTDRISRRLID